VEFGSLVTFGVLDVPKVLGDFHRANPFVRLSLRLSQVGSSAYMTSVADGSLDLALVSAPTHFPRVSMGDIAGEDFVGFPPGFGIRILVDDAFAAAGVTPRTQYEVPADYTVAAGLIRNDLGTAFMPANEASRCPDLTAIELETPIVWKIFLAQPRPRNISPAAARLASMLLDAAGGSGEPSRRRTRATGSAHDRGGSSR
jgi:DNA-binding transcriptional LysR family regulator